MWANLLLEWAKLHDQAPTQAQTQAPLAKLLEQSVRTTVAVAVEFPPLGAVVNAAAPLGESAAGCLAKNASVPQLPKDARDDAVVAAFGAVAVAHHPTLPEPQGFQAGAAQLVQRQAVVAAGIVVTALLVAVEQTVLVAVVGDLK